MTEQQSEATQAEASAQSQADSASDDDRATQADAQDTISLDEAKKLRSEAASLRKRLKDAEAKVQAAEEAGKSDEEKRAQALTDAQERAEAAERRLREATGRSAIYDAATKANAISLGAVWALAKDGLEYDDDGEPTNVDEVLAGLKKSEAQLFRHSGGRGDGGAGTDTKREVTPGYGRLLNAYETSSKTARR